MASNKPSWDDAPEWANWLACDSPKAGPLVGSKGEWWWYEEEPMISITDYECWTNHSMTKYLSAGVCADSAWAKNNWKTSVEQRPEAGDEPAESNPYLTDDRKRRITLFIDFDDPIFNDEQLAQNIAEMLCNRLGTSMAYPGNKFTPGGGSVDRIRVAIGKELMNKIAYDPDDGFYIESKEND